MRRSHLAFHDATSGRIGEGLLVVVQRSSTVALPKRRPHVALGGIGEAWRVSHREEGDLIRQSVPRSSIA